MTSPSPDDRRYYARSRPAGFAPWAPKGRSVTTLADVRQVLLDDFGADQWPVTNRQVLYRLIGAYAYTKPDEDHVENVVKRARRAGLLPWDAIDDGRARVDTPFEVGDEADWWRWCADLAAAQLQLRRQDGQPQVTLLWTEAAGLIAQLARVAEPYGVAVYSTSGFATTTTLHRIATHAQVRYQADKDAGRDPRRTVVLHVGDRDDDGISAYSRVCQELEEFAWGLGLPGDLLDVPRAAITVEQITRHGVVTEPPKARPARRSDGTANTPRGGAPLAPPLAQVEALTPQELADEITAVLDALTDPDALAAVVAAEDDVRAAVLRRLANLRRRRSR